MKTISFILMILMNDSAVLLSGEIKGWSLLEFKGLRDRNFVIRYFINSWWLF